MSLHPPKHSELKFPKKREKHEKRLHLDYNLIICEGKKTEPNYFNALKERIEKKEKNKLQIEIIGTGRNTRSLFEYAKEFVQKSANGYSRVWLVYDKDDFPAENFNVTEEMCKENSSEEGTEYIAVWSNQCIELWFLLHFMYLQSDLHRSEYYPKLTDCLADKGEYQKNREDIFEILFPHLNFAILNAKKLEKENKGKTPSASVPGTRVHVLMEEMKDFL